MPLPQTIHSLVDPAAITKVTRMFNNSLSDILVELVQNARRAGSTGIDIELATDEAGRTILTFLDDGTGIDDPTVLLALGRSDWNQETRAREDPAGMGVFSLAGLAVEIRSFSEAAKAGWSVAIPADAWETGEPVRVMPSDHSSGTMICFALDEVWQRQAAHCAAAAALYCPLPVRLNGKHLEQKDWLDGAARVFVEDGVRIGVYPARSIVRSAACINFHGLTVSTTLPSISEAGEQHWMARIDIINAPALQLVLPARKEMVQNDALETLKTNVKRAIFRYIGERGSHRLGHELWCHARDLGIELPEARFELDAWSPTKADWNARRGSAECLTGAGLIIVDNFGPAFDQCAALALDRDDRFAGKLVFKDTSMTGYSWYDALPRITGVSFDIHVDGRTERLDDDEFPGIDSGEVDRIDLHLDLCGMETDRVTIPAPIAIEYDEGTHWGIDDASILLTPGHGLAPEQLVDLLDAICFSASDERDADSWETQHGRFLLDAREITIRLLEGEDSALTERLHTILVHRAQWLVPDGRQFVATIARDKISIELETLPPSTDPKAV